MNMPRNPGYSDLEWTQIQQAMRRLAEDRMYVLVTLSLWFGASAAGVLFAAVIAGLAWLIPGHVAGIGWACIATTAVGVALAVVSVMSNIAAGKEPPEWNLMRQKGANP